MSRDELFNLYDEIVQEARDTMSAKNQDYAWGGDCLANLREAAHDVELEPELVWYVYFNKQVQAIKSHANGKVLQSESLRSRIVDCINFLVLLEGLDKDRDKEEIAVKFDRAGENGSAHTGPQGLLACRLAS